MAAAAADIVGNDLVGGVIVAPQDDITTIPHLTCLAGGHPLPSATGQHSTRALLDFVGQHPAAAVIALISGGASSLMVQPTPPLTLGDKIAVNRALLECGAEIHEFNTVRKHLSQIKGGGLARRARGRPLVGLIISDVIGDEPGTIGSGPTAPDPTTFADALDVVDRYKLREKLPSSVVQVLELGKQAQLPETLKADAAELRDVANFVIGSNRIALEAAAAAARVEGFDPLIRAEPLSGDTATAARQFVEWIKKNLADGLSRRCFLAGGETTVRLTQDHGRGGRNQEFALVAAAELAGMNVHLLSAGTDGIDGPTDAAGAFADATTVIRAEERQLDLHGAIMRHDSYGFFEALGDLFRSGPTGTNVMDIKITLAPGVA